MTDPDLCAIVLAAGEGVRLRPLTAHRPKVLCPVGNVALLDRAIERVTALGLDLAVNASYLASQVAEHVGDRAHLSVEPVPLGTAGGVATLKGWVDGRGALAVNADAYLAHPELGPGPDIAALLDGWDGTTVRLLVVPAGDREPEFGPYRFAGASLLPWPVIRDLRVELSELVRRAWRPAEAAGTLELTEFRGAFFDTGTPGDYLDANLYAAEGGDLVAPGATVRGSLHQAVVGAGAVVEGRVTRGVVWPGGYVGPDEHVVDAVRVGPDLTVHR
jgi:NDP-sugar pyrophosphorylase family protein